jgi:hypothetical protein
MRQCVRRFSTRRSEEIKNSNCLPFAVFLTGKVRFAFSVLEPGTECLLVSYSSLVFEKEEVLFNWDGCEGKTENANRTFPVKKRQKAGNCYFWFLHFSLSRTFLHIAALRVPTLIWLFWAGPQFIVTRGHKLVRTLFGFNSRKNAQKISDPSQSM